MAVTVLGVDIGSLQDHTALVITQQVPLPENDPENHRVPDQFEVALGWAPPPKHTMHFYIRAMERLPLGVAYRDISRKIALIATRLYNRDATGEQYVIIDCTGVGRPVLEQVQDQLEHLPKIHVTGVTITVSQQADRNVLYNEEAHVGKTYMARRLQMVIQEQRLHWDKGNPLSVDLVQEFLDYEIRVTKSLNDVYGAFKAGSHDDLVTAVGLTVLEDRLNELPYHAAAYI